MPVWFWKLIFLIPKASIAIFILYISPLFLMLLETEGPTNWDVVVEDEIDMIYAYCGIINMEFQDYLLGFVLISATTFVLVWAYSNLKPYELGLKYVDGEWSF